MSDGFHNNPLFKVNLRAKRILFRFDQKMGRAVVVFPHKSYLKKADRYRDDFNAWIATMDIPLKKTLDEGEIILYRGENHRVCFIPEPLYSKARVEITQGLDTIKENILSISGRKEHMNTAIHDFLMMEAQSYAFKKSHFYAEVLGVTLGKTTIRDLKSMWGRCMRQKDLCYNWRLILAPSHVFDYVCAHEVSHCSHPNHSRDFWETVAYICPHFKQSHLWLKQNSKELFSYSLG